MQVSCWTRIASLLAVPVTFIDGGASGATKIVVNTKASSTSADYILMPGEGLLFQNNIYIVPSAVISTMVIYG
jgi:hypothetical protein